MLDRHKIKTCFLLVLMVETGVTFLFAPLYYQGNTPPLQVLSLFSWKMGITLQDTLNNILRKKEKS